MISINIMPELKRNILNFGYGVNFKYQGMLSHSFDRFYVVTKFELPKVEDLKLTTVQFDPNAVIQLLEMIHSCLAIFINFWHTVRKLCIM